MITDKLAIENYMLIDIDDSFDDQLDEWIEGVEQEMNMMTDRQLVADDTAGEYKYDGNGKKEMLIDDFVDIDSIEVDGEDLTEDIYQYPANKLPKYQLKIDDYIFTKGRQNIVITGKKGYAAEANIPKDLKMAATILVAGIINFSNSHEGEIHRESIGRYTVEYATDQQKIDYKTARATIERYRRIR